MLRKSAYQKEEKRVGVEIKRLSMDEYEKKVIELAKKGLSAEKIGEYLKTEGVYSKDYRKKISRILKERGLYVSPDILNLKKKLEKLEKHCQKNKQDKRALRERERLLSKLKKIESILETSSLQG
ncbi:MAG: hypothetical protein QXU40_00430 [Candidatus Pacearchaeota archaeon]